ncbi:Peptidoglycan/LPS O-acetylase OafA/YrhL, contains acyltransferase and SGNH-hydrolase domains [Kaistia soli DSM 19436]|uniref:Peptidoglycan/LPS O-acetylase OafA/YrhL, contains acyltransferase and SGNH-hydrolase domains n=1 Tax=Kaistia soli DSM 19436 TaxID=1122133 RepID=A0A1M4WWV1_9HYPH|nr:acyltransferase family protein [Kaistia soli]SHE85724.1 Peptidoglycan/LPS O-acetylase OafA/YrhL, contains acyltransferase and SGNH-hydrolase domains [Kaistia soli DSM 19436]
MRLGADAIAGKPGLDGAQARGADGYKPHVDGLRAIAIVAAVAYHAEVPGFAGGFVGVDIFFVISGYLIINQILGQLAAGRFGIFDFYARRALRILPSYGAMLLFTLIGATLVMRSPGELGNYAVSALLAPLFLTNVYFLFRSGYFDTGSALKPLLHTWSLAVEEQFYLIVPLLLIGVALLARRRQWPMARLLAIAATVIGLASLIGCILATPHDANPWAAERNPAFFLTWWRAWEFVAGGILAALAAPFVAGRRTMLPGTLAGIAGLALLALSITFTGLEWMGVRHAELGRVMGFPGAAALMPVAGAMLVIWSGLVAPRGPVALLLSLAPVVYLGQISYALYLWHWPLLVFGRFLPLQVSPTTVDAIALAIAVLLSIATRYAIELPILAWRRRVKLGSDRRLPVRIFLASVAGCIAVTVVSGGVVGLAYRNAGDNPMVAAIAASEVHPNNPCASEDIDVQTSCLDGIGAAGLLIGDSHAFAMMPRIEYEAEQQGLAILQLAMPGCDPIDVMLDRAAAAANSFCRPLVEKFDRFMPRIGGAKFAIFDGYWNARFRQTGDDHAVSADRLRTGFAALMKTFAGNSDRRILVVAPLPSFWRTDPFNCLDLSRALGLSADRCGVPRAIEEDWRRETIAIMQEIVATYPNARMIDPIDLFCDERICMPIKDGTLAFFDSNHLNAYGTKVLFDAFRADYLWAFKG